MNFPWCGCRITLCILGSESDPGIMFLCIRDIFEWIEQHKNTECSLRVSYMEVYNEEINDLLGTDGEASKNLRIVSEDSIKGATIGNLVEELAESPKQLMELLQRGEHNRSYGSTAMNSDSSRSHTIYRLGIEVKTLVDDENASAGSIRSSFLNLVDLAGSERQKTTGTSGKQLKEGANINKSLLALGACINKLGESSKKVWWWRRWCFLCISCDDVSFR